MFPATAQLSQRYFIPYHSLEGSACCDLHFQAGSARTAYHVGCLPRLRHNVHTIGPEQVLVVCFDHIL
jgi:hypothetical protein